MKTILITQRWKTGDEDRDRELDHCRDVNRMLFGDEYIAIGWQDQRTTFGDLMQRCGPGLNILCNSDIYLSSASLATITGYYEVPGREKVCMALSRWDVLPDLTCRHHAHRDSQDTWIFLGRPPKALIEAAGAVGMGLPGCDNALAYAIFEAGYTLINPSVTVRTYHLHNSGYRTYGTGRGYKKSEAVPPPYFFVNPTVLK